MSAIALELTVREKHGTIQAKKIRRQGLVPGIFYFHGKEAVPFTATSKDLQATLGHESALLDVHFSSGDKRKCIVRELQFDPITHAILHVDLMGIQLDEKIKVSVPVHLTGIPVGVKTDGGILQQVIRELDIECLPGDIPEAIEIDVTGLGIGDSVQVSSITTDKYTIMAEPERTLATVSALRQAEEAPVVSEETTAEPEIITRRAESEDGKEG